jgi:serine/threonine-protein kinase HipA
MARTLDVYLHKDLVGHLVQSDGGEIVFSYAESWLTRPGATPLSQSLPLRKMRFKRNECRGFFSGILPDEPNEKSSPAIWASARATTTRCERGSAANARGAVTFLPTGQALPEHRHDYRKLSPAELAAILRELPRRPLLAGEHGMRLSLAGAQDKIAVRIEDGEVCLPQGGAPSTHILKPAVERFEGVVFNEALCMKLAAEAGLLAASVETRNIDGLDFLIVERYDRIHTQEPGAKPVRKLHQEDFCQGAGHSARTQISKRRRTVSQTMLRVAPRGIQRSGHPPAAPARLGHLQLPRRQQ